MVSLRPCSHPTASWKTILLVVLLAVAAAGSESSQETPPPPPQAVVSISYADLQSYFEEPQENSSSSPPPQHLLDAMQDAFGPASLGFLQVTDIPPDMVALREQVLDLARDLANLPESDLQALERPDTAYTIGWSRGKEEFRPGVPDIGKGSFYYNPFGSSGQQNVFPTLALPNLEAALERMTHFMAKVGLWIVQLMDAHLKLPDMRIHDSLESCEMAKARLLYYYPPSECQQTTTDVDNTNNDSNNDPEQSSWWCGWHKDHGSLTALLPGKLIDDKSDSNDSDATTTLDDTHKPQQPAGLYIETMHGQKTHVSMPPTSLGFQLGETIQLMSHGRLRATPHAVKAPGNGGMGRASLALFLQPPAHQVLPAIQSQSNADPSLQARWRPTFGAFQKATTETFQ